MLNQINEDSPLIVKTKESKIFNNEKDQLNTISEPVQHTISEDKTNVMNEIVKDSIIPIEANKTILDTEKVKKPHFILEDSIDINDSSSDSSKIDENVLINEEGEDEENYVHMMHDFIDND